MSSLTVSTNLFDPEGYWITPIADASYIPSKDDVALFDQNGYDLTVIEQQYVKDNIRNHREHRYCIKKAWLQQEPVDVGAVLNHSLLFERKGYQGAALEQLQQWAIRVPLLHKVIAMRPKWGLDFSMDYVDHQGNAFEILHWEWDSFDYEEIQVRKLQVQARLATTDWDDAGQQLLKRKDEWHHLDFFAQSEWKCRYFGIINERFKMVIWE